MRKLTIRIRIFYSFAVVLVLMLAMGTTSYWSLSRIQVEVRDLEGETLPSLTISYEISHAWLVSHALTQGRISETDKATLEQLDAGLRANQAALSDLIDKYKPFVAIPSEQVMYDTLRAVHDEYVHIQNEILSLGANGKAQEAQTLLREQLTPSLLRAEKETRALIDLNNAEKNDSGNEVFSAIRTAEASILIGMTLGLVLAILLGYLLLRAIVNPLGQLCLDLGKSGFQVSSSVSEIAATAQEHQATASEIAATTMEIGATSKEISATSKELVKTMNEVATVAEQSAVLAGNGRVGLGQMEETMRHVMEAAGSINTKLVVLNEKASNINQIVATITKVADQTNLLSLNAAIEAEKAGEHGRGFSVVATEIRRLSDQTSVATYDIEQTVKEIESAVSASVMGMDKFSEEVRRGMQEMQQVSDQLSQIIQQVQALAPRVESVDDGMQAQATGAEQITQALVQLTEATQQTVDSLRQSNRAIEGLNGVVSGLSDGVTRLKVLI